MNTDTKNTDTENTGTANTDTEHPVTKRRVIRGVLTGLFLLWILIFISGSFLSWRQKAQEDITPSGNPLDVQAEKDLGVKIDRMRISLKKMSPKGIHVIVDSGRNILYLKNGDTIIKEAIVSCGSGNVLEIPDDQRRWVFDTPRGVFTVNSRISNPAWIKPDWAFIEEGETVPKDPRLRYETGVLGDYALGFGDGYFIHGTLYTRLLGRNVTHGCIRVGDEDLKAVFKTARIGTPIFIY